MFTHSDYSRPNSFRLLRPVSGSSISSKNVGKTRSLATRTLGIPKLLKCINKAQPEPCYEKTQLQSWSHVIKKHSSGAGTGAMLTKTESSGAGAISFLQELRSPA